MMRLGIEGHNGVLRSEAISDASWIYDVVGGIGGLAKAGLKFAFRRLCSFHGDTQVATDKGFVKIRRIRPEKHKVWARHEHTGQMKFQTVMDAYSNPYKETVTLTIRDMKTGEQQTIVSNKIHPFYVSTGAKLMKLVSNGGFVTEGTNDTGEWIKAAELKAGHRLLNAGKGENSESWSEVVSVKVVKESLRAYNLHVDKFHTYYVRGADNDNAKAVWVHNACPPNLTPSGGGRRAAFRAAKRNSGIPASKNFDRIGPNYDKRGKLQPGKSYEFDMPKPGGGKETLTIRDDAGGHNYGYGNPQNRGRHFNDTSSGHYDY